MFRTTATLTAIILLGLISTQASAQTVFTYQGRLADGGTVVNGAFDFSFTLWDAETNGTSFGTVNVNALTVTAGEFSAQLDFGPGVFDGADRWLEIAVRQTGGGAFTTLTPRQPITPAPYAQHSSQADIADGAVFADTAALAESVQYQDVENAPISETSLCVKDNGDPGVIIGGICVLDFDNASSTAWSAAAASCTAMGGDLCSTSQYQTLRTNRPDLFTLDRAVWSSDFSDNDNGSKIIALHSSDNPSSSQMQSYACCKVVTASEVRTQASTFDNVPVTFLKSEAEFTWPAAAMVCHARGADLCTASQYVSLNDNGLFSANTHRLTNEFSDNDGGDFDAVLGIGSPDNPSSTDYFAFACCSSLRPVDESCPGTLQTGSVCTGTIHDTEDSNFFDAARACAAEGADLCSKSEMQVLRDNGLFSNACWTQDGSDNDGANVGGLLAGQPDNPDPASDLFGYACCY